MSWRERHKDKFCFVTVKFKEVWGEAGSDFIEAVGILWVWKSSSWTVPAECHLWSSEMEYWICEAIAKWKEVGSEESPWGTTKDNRGVNAAWKNISSEVRDASGGYPVEEGGVRNYSKGWTQIKDKENGESSRINCYKVVVDDFNINKNEHFSDLKCNAKCFTCKNILRPMHTLLHTPST